MCYLIIISPDSILILFPLLFEIIIFGACTIWLSIVIVITFMKLFQWLQQQTSFLPRRTFIALQFALLLRWLIHFLETLSIVLLWFFFRHERQRRTFFSLFICVQWRVHRALTDTPSDIRLHIFLLLPLRDVKINKLILRARFTTIGFLLELENRTSLASYKTSLNLWNLCFDAAAWAWPGSLWIIA